MYEQENSADSRTLRAVIIEPSGENYDFTPRNIFFNKQELEELFVDDIVNI
jgi:hypothetical protein